MGGFNDIISQVQVDAILSGTPNNVYYVKMNKYEKRKLSKCYIRPVSVCSGSLNEIVSTSGKTKIIATALYSYNYTGFGNPLGITMVHACKPYNSQLTNAYTDFPNGGVYGYFNLYILEDVVNGGKGLAIEFLSIDAITVPFNNKIGINNTLTYSYFAKFRNTFISIPTNNSRLDSDLMIDFIPILSSLGGLRRTVLNNLSKSKSINVIRLYSDRTCDVFNDALKLHMSLYNNNSKPPGIGDRRVRLYHYKLIKTN